VSARVRRVRAWQALDSRGRPTVACRVDLASGASGRAIVPSGASAGSHEAHELRDGGASYGGLGVLRAVAHVNGILNDVVEGVDASETGAVDAALTTVDDSPGFAVIGANAVLAVSLASAIAAAADAGVSLARHLAGPGELLLPMPMVNVLSGGAHAPGGLDIQDFLVIPCGARSFAQAIEWAARVREAATTRARQLGHHASALVADEGGLGVPLSTNRSALELLTRSIEDAGLVPGVDAGIAIDAAASQFYQDGRYVLRSEQRVLDASELRAEVVGWCADFPVLSVEDPLDEDDWTGWAELTARLGGSIEVVGDDLFVTQSERLRHGVETGAANSVLIKVNQNGLLSRTHDVVSLARASGYRTVVSARSGDTEDTWLADLAVGWRAGQIKVGSTHRSERNAKWNRLLELEATQSTSFAGPWSAQQAPEPGRALPSPRWPITVENEGTSL
jgi:enolase